MTVSKYSANGNDFVIFHTFVEIDRSALAQNLCHRHEGVGADGLIVLLPHATYDFKWQFYNADGSEAAMCGNGSRAAAHYAFAHGLAPQSMRFLTGAGVIGAKVDGDVVTSELTPPKLTDDNIEAFDKRWWLIDTGVPHLVAFVDDISTFNIDEARQMRHRYNANVNIATIEEDKLRVRTYERGVEDETLACGTGMAACFFRANQEGLVGEKSTVMPRGGESVVLAKRDRTLTLTGKVACTFNAQIVGIKLKETIV